MKFSWKDCVKLGVTVFLTYLCITHWREALKLVGALLGASIPLAVGGIVAYLVNILMARYEALYFPGSQKNAVLKSRRPVCMVLAFVTLIAIVALVALLVIPQLTSCVQILLAGLPDFMNNTVDMVEGWGLLSEETLASLNDIDWNSRIGELVKVITSGIGDVMSVLFSALSSVFSWIVTGVLSVIFSVYILASKETLHSQLCRIMDRYMPESINRRIRYVTDVLDDCFRRYIVGQCTEAVILGCLCALGMWILRLPYAAMIGTLMAFTALIPIAGAYIGAGVCAFMILTVDPFKALIFLIFIIVLQQLEGNLIYPKVVGSSLGLPGIWVLASVTVGGGIMGIGGMLLGVPLAAAIYRLIREDVLRREAGASSEAPAGEADPPEHKIQ
jgi:predicted PurR-regulated permease PerM